MIKYFKEKWKEGDDIIEEDVIEEVCELEKNIESIDGNVKFYCTFVYASNNKEERKILWKELYMHKRDIGSTGFFYTWTKSLKNPDNSVLKKLDRVMVTESFHEDFARSQAIFLPFMISDHSPAVLVIPSFGIKKAKSFRVANYIADKSGFISEVSKQWNNDIQGYKMYSLVKKIKALKPVLNKMNWKNGDLTGKVENLRNY
ncbi:hypothetical protein Tco_0943901 [Tanacetum coccineum]